MGLSVDTGVPLGRDRAANPGWLLLGLSAGIPGTPGGTDRAANLRFIWIELIPVGRGYRAAWWLFWG